jgi:hypothetical protein
MYTLVYVGVEVVLVAKNDTANGLLLVMQGDNPEFFFSQFMFSTDFKFSITHNHNRRLIRRELPVLV